MHQPRAIASLTPSFLPLIALGSKKTTREALDTSPARYMARRLGGETPETPETRASLSSVPSANKG